MWGYVKLNPHHCFARYYDRTTKTQHACTRPHGHDGDHQSFTRTWPA